MNVFLGLAYFLLTPRGPVLLEKSIGLSENSRP